MNQTFLKLSLCVLLAPLMHMCTTNHPIDDGLYTTTDNDMFYGIEITENQSKVKFFMLSNWSSFMTEEVIKQQHTFTDYRTGDLILDNNHYKITNLETDFFHARNDTLEVWSDTDGITLECAALERAFFSPSSAKEQGKLNIRLGNQPCPGKKIHFKKKR